MVAASTLKLISRWNSRKSIFLLLFVIVLCTLQISADSSFLNKHGGRNFKQPALYTSVEENRRPREDLTLDRALKTSHGSQSHLKNYKHTQRHSRDSHTNLDENGDWENLLLGPLARKYPELRQIYKRASSDERLLSASQILTPFSVPKFELPHYQRSCDEDVPIGTSLLQVKATALPDEVIIYSLTDSVNFTIDSNGTIRSNAKLDADLNGRLYTFNVTARVQGGSGEGMAFVRINTENRNDEPPRFEQDIYPARVDEKANPHAVVTTVVARDIDDGDKVKYGLASGDFPPGMFVVDEDSGVIRLGASQPRFDKDTYEFNITATDDGSCCPGGQNTIHTSTALVVVKIIDVNDNKPVFKECDTYKPKVKENEPVGTMVIQVFAEDLDRGDNGKVTYRYVSKTDSLFDVNPDSGELRTKKVFDREGSDGKSIPVTIIAADKGNPSLEGVCSFIVAIEDVNDNSPLFDRISYNEKIKQQTPVGSDIFRLSSTDNDADNNAAIEYSLQPDSSDSKFLEYFKVNPESGWVSLQKPIDTIFRFTFKAVATDKGSPPLNSTVSVNIEVIKNDINPPVWEKSNYTVEIPENAKEDSIVISLRARSGIKDDHRVIYKLVYGQTPQTNSRRNFDVKDLGTGTADIQVIKALDYEDIKEYNLTVRAENGGGRAAETTVYVKLTDVNDEIPEFSDFETLTVLEQEPVGTRVGQIHAIDKDSTFPFNVVTYSLEDIPGVPLSFSINKDSGELRTEAKFDREKNRTIQIRVKITDGAPSARPNAQLGLPNSYVSNFNVFIGDTNDNKPTFENESYQAEVNENEDKGHLVVIIKAYDEDESSTLRYEITDGNVGGAFSIRSETGEISVAGNVDYETLNSYSLTVTVTDGLNEVNTKVAITVVDVNDNRPVFDKPTYNATIWERIATNNSGLPEPVVKVSVTDADANRPKEFVYFLTGQAKEIGPNGRETFEINSDTGEIFLNVPLDRDLPNGRPTWRFNVFARDEGGRQGSLDGYADVVVNLRDINDNDPSFPEANYVGHVPENSNAGQHVMDVQAVDYDDPSEGTNAILTYSITKNAVEGSNELFSMDPAKGTIRTKVGNLDRERTSSYVIEVVATDGGGRSGTGTVTISIKDVNDSPPRFEQDEYILKIPETYALQDPILYLNVLDDDLPDTNYNFFSIEEGFGWGGSLFHVNAYNKTTAELRVKSQLDYENKDHRRGFSIKIKVNDKGQGSNDQSHIAFCVVNITITDINDNPPVFTEPQKSSSVSEDAPVGTSLEKFHATDADNDGLSKVSYSIERSTNRQRHFVIDADGVVRIQRKVDREEVARHIVHIIATDDGSPRKSSTATLTVNVQDINDNPPEFKEDYHPVVPENQPPEIFVIELAAYDKDDYGAGNGPPFKFSLAESATVDIKESFRLEFISSGDFGNGSAKIYTKIIFDREQQKQYFIPIVIKDSGSPPLTATSTLTVTIGDENDNPMFDGSTNIFVYNYKGKAPRSPIGRVYVDDKDDWDLPYKYFDWDGEQPPNFDLDHNTGTIIMNGTLSGDYFLKFIVKDEIRQEEARANATITIKEISEKAVTSSGSIRMKNLSEEDFVSVWDSKDNRPKNSKYNLLKNMIVDLIKAKPENVDLFTVKKKQQISSPPILDVRFSVHGSPYYTPERINGPLLTNREKIEEVVGVDILMIGIDECIYENVNCEGSCSNELIATETPYVVNANRTSFAGVNSEVVAQCTCRARNFSQLENCGTIKCFNGGTCYTLPTGNPVCFCRKGFDGPRCQQTTIGFKKAGYAWVPALQQCEESHLSLEFLTKNLNGLLFYNGPIANAVPNEVNVQDFVSLELQDGMPRLLIDFGSGTLELKVASRPLNDEEWHTIDVFWNPELVRVVVDSCKGGEKDDRDNTNEGPLFKRDSCEATGSTPLFNEYLNVNTPLQIGGVSHSKLNYQWNHTHTREGFIGCIKNVMVNGELYDMAYEALRMFAELGCPLTEQQCRTNDIKPFCENGICIGSKAGPYCECKPGFLGTHCDLVAPESTLYQDSYINYTLKFAPDNFQSEIMVRFRTRETSGELFRAVGDGRSENLVVEIVDGYLNYNFNLHKLGSRGGLTLSEVPVNDGQWHSLKVRRYGSVASLSLDGGEGRRYNETVEYESLRQLIKVRENGVFVGGYLKTPDFRNSCVSDIRFDASFKQLPLPPHTFENEYAVATHENMDNYCVLDDTCDTAICPLGFLCLPVWGTPVCTCPFGYVVGIFGTCVDYNECDDFPCENGGTCENKEGSYVCHCVTPYTGENCTLTRLEEPFVYFSSAALAAMLSCALVILILALVLVVYTRSKRTNYGPVYPEDDIRENIINYDDEGGGEDDMNTYDLGALRIPLDGPVDKLVSEKPVMKEPLPIRAYSPDSEPNVGDFINNNLGKANDDPDAAPFDDVRLYAYEGAGSTAGSLSSLASGTDDNEQDFDYLNNWGPRFQKLADMYGQGESEEE